MRAPLWAAQEEVAVTTGRARLTLPPLGILALYTPEDRISPFSYHFAFTA